MGYLSDIEWKGGSTFEDIDIWFCDPMREFLEMFDEQFGQNQFEPEDKRAVFFYYEMRNKVDELSKLFEKLGNECPDKPRKSCEARQGVKKIISEMFVNSDFKKAVIELCKTFEKRQAAVNQNEVKA